MLAGMGWQQSHGLDDKYLQTLGDTVLVQPTCRVCRIASASSPGIQLWSREVGTRPQNTKPSLTVRSASYDVELGCCDKLGDQLGEYVARYCYSWAPGCDQPVSTVWGLKLTCLCIVRYQEQVPEC